MSKKLFIVESPAKAKTINKYLGTEFKVIASYGHIRDLPKKNGSIDVDHEFAPKYQIATGKKKYVDEIIGGGRECDEIYLATDPDREGEAIAWHIKEVLLGYKDIAKKPIKRVSFNEITKSAIINAVSHPRELNFNLIDAQQARLALDYLIGFNISPLLWRKVRAGLSAGRVQSPALRLICEREDEIKKFVPEDYFTVLLNTHKGLRELVAKLIDFNGTKIETRTVNKKTWAEDICADIGVNKNATVTKINKKQKKKNPLPPFITSSLQIESSRKLGFDTNKTMKVAQSLYEGVDIGNEVTGLISYMRTDSVNLSEQALDDIRNYIQQNYPQEYLPVVPVKYVSKVKNAQEAHEAIRPTAITRSPDSMKKYLTLDQFRLYELIWLRALASQISSAILDTTAVDIKVGNGTFRLNGVIVNFDGFMRVYQEEKDDAADAKNDDEYSVKLPELNVGEVLPVDKVDFTEHQTEPKPRYSEASLVKSLEEFGIGRPSTYATIISTLKKREYVIMDKKRFIPTEIGMIVSQFLTNHLTNYVDLKFTANLEDKLDDISNGKSTRLPMLDKFWHELKTIIEEKQGIARADLTAEKLEENCLECGKQLLVKLGRYGKFVGCSGYPDCKYMRKVDSATGEEEAIREEPEVIEGRLCPKDGGVLLIRSGRYGKFISCKNYPKCKYIESIDKPENDVEGVDCPECKKGNIIAKKNRYGSWFYACGN
ncbi:MAG: type I DNA topoisomerase, partial [Burkholderiales bacterium]|nr:type I DNA topoisomerase [Burkholderiales bacterium]